MSATTRKQGRITVPAIRARKGAEPIVCLTAYTTPMAQRLDRIAIFCWSGIHWAWLFTAWKARLPSPST